MGFWIGLRQWMQCPDYFVDFCFSTQQLLYKHDDGDWHNRNADINWNCEGNFFSVSGHTIVMIFTAPYFH
jgi:hypothetical protein